MRLPFSVIADRVSSKAGAHALEMASALKNRARVGMGLVYKTSFDKAKPHQRGRGARIGLEASLRSSRDPRKLQPAGPDGRTTRPRNASRVAQASDVLQIPAFLCRQTDSAERCARDGGV